MKFHPRWAVAVLSVIVLGASSIVHAAAVSGQGTWETTLQARDFDGNTATIEGYYDTALNITWLADTLYYAIVPMTWSYANTWAAGLNFNGITGWRLPTTIDADGPDADALGNDGCSYTNGYQGLDCGYNISVHSEMSHMFYVTLGNKAYYSTTGTAAQPGWGLTNTADFTGVQAYRYWSATEYAPSTSSAAWSFHFDYGDQFGNGKADVIYAWAVHSGDVGAAIVPVPAAAWLFSSGLAALIGFARRKSGRAC